ncbi:hypothetical protein BGZ63DRAFT_78365 [Mariannaea sp. PMI_226]|nr:hypothetical protein BGZ63DRAFT_78365 [Mariannaea sp. PMI_226]
MCVCVCVPSLCFVLYHAVLFLDSGSAPHGRTRLKRLGDTGLVHVPCPMSPGRVRVSGCLPWLSHLCTHLILGGPYTLTHLVTHLTIQYLLTLLLFTFDGSLVCMPLVLLMVVMGWPPSPLLVFPHTPHNR